MKKFNLTEWALNHKQFIYFFIALLFSAGAFSYMHLGRMEDPDFTIKQMVVSVAWPGATAQQIEEQVTDKIEKKLQDLPGLDYLKSYSAPGQTLIYVNLKDQVPKKDVRGKWVEARNMVNDIKGTLPQGVSEPMFNDHFDDVYGVMYALTGDEYSYEDMRQRAEKIRRILLGVPSVSKVQMIGVQSEKVYIEIENSKLAQLGMSPSLITSTLQAQNAMAAAGMLETSSDNIYLRISGMFDDLEDIRNTPIQANGNTFRLGDIAKVTRGYTEPSDPKFFYNGQPAIGISLSMEPGGNILTLGENLKQAIAHIQKELPAGLDITQTINQPEIVKDSINEFIESLVEAVLIVLVVSFISLGLRSGLIVACCIPLVIAAVFTAMNLLQIDLQRTSLGALIIALGLLVDDAIITIETMVVKLEEGWTRFDAACFAYTSTAYPRLTGELVTCAGFIPIAFSQGSASEYCVTLFYVVTLALLISWIVAGTVTPLFGYLFIKVKQTKENEEPRKSMYDTRFYRKFKKILVFCLMHRKTVLLGTVACFIMSIGLLSSIKQEFFPLSTRPELIVQLKLEEGASLKDTEAVATRFAQELNENQQVSYYTYHLGEGAPRFVLSFDPTFPKSNFAEFVIIAPDAVARDALRTQLEQLLNEKFSNVSEHTKVVEIGMPSDYPIMLRVKGYDHDKVREIAEKVRDTMAATPGAKNVSLNWDEKSKELHLTIDQDKARALGISSQDLASSLQTQLSGATVAEFRKDDRTVSMVVRFDQQERNDPAYLKNLNIYLGNGKYVPLEQIAKISYGAEEGLIYRRDLKPTIIVQAETRKGFTGDDVVQKVYDQLANYQANLPFGYSLEFDGAKEDSMKALKFLVEPVPFMIIMIMILLMVQLQNIAKMVLTLLTAPLGIIGVSVGLFLTNSPLGFVVQLGILALAGIIMRNSVMLMDQIQQQLDTGVSMWESIIDATVIRLRPILLTATAAILGMLPLFPSVFWGPMAIAIASGLFGSTILTLIVLPVMYAAWYKVQPSQIKSMPSAVDIENPEEI